MIRTALLCLATFVPLIGAAKAGCDDRFINTCDVRSWHGARHHKSEFRVKRHREGSRRAASAVEEKQGGLEKVCVEGHCGTVIARAAEKFKGLFQDLVSMGYNIGSPGCYSPTGHMRHSLHHWGGACDLFNQYARNRCHLKQPPPQVQIEVAAKHGLTSGCGWRDRDCGHFDLSGIGPYAMISHRRHARVKKYAKG